MKYITLLKKNKSGDNNNYPLLAKEAKLNCQSISLDVEKEICSKEIELEHAKSSANFSPQDCFRLQNAIDLKKRELAYYESLEKELFSK